MWLWGTAAAKDGAIATGGFALIRLKPCAGYSPIHGLRFAVRLSLIENIFRVREVSICRNIALRLLAVAGKMRLD